MSAVGVRAKVYSLLLVSWEEFKKFHLIQRPILERLKNKNLSKCLKKIKKPWKNPRKKGLTLKNSELKKLRGVKKHIVKSKIEHADYKTSIHTGEPMYVEYLTIQSRGHEVTSTRKKKLGLSNFYDKREVLRCKGALL